MHVFPNPVTYSYWPVDHTKGITESHMSKFSNQAPEDDRGSVQSIMLEVNQANNWLYGIENEINGTFS